MFAVIFEVQPKRERWDEYLGIARGLRPKLEAIDGFMDNERYRSQRTEGRLLSLSIWRDEKAVIRWRTQAEAKMAVFKYIEGFYNPRRRHSALDYLSPINYERFTPLAESA